MERQVISSAGSSLIQDEYSIDFTISEIMTSTLTNGNALSQGFRQV